MQFEIPMLMDFYGQLLTEKNRALLALHYEEDMSFSEIADVEGISRQAVHDAVRRGVRLLQGYEGKLGLVQRFISQKESVEKAVDALSDNQGDQAKDILLGLLEQL